MNKRRKTSNPVENFVLSTVAVLVIGLVLVFLTLLATACLLPVILLAWKLLGGDFSWWVVVGSVAFWPVFLVMFGGLSVSVQSSLARSDKPDPC